MTQGCKKWPRGGRGMVVQIKLYFQEFSSEHPKDYLLFQNFCLSYHEDFYYLKDYKSRERCTWGPKNALTKEGVGGIKFKRKSNKRSHNNFRKKVKKIRVGWLTIFFKDEGGRLTPPPS